MRYLRVFFLLFIILAGSCEKKISKYSDIELDNYLGSSVNITSLEGEWMVMVFLSPECPLSENYTLTLKNLQAEFKSQDIAFYLIFPGTFYPRPQIEQFAKLYSLDTMSIYYDENYKLRDYCAATITPEVFIFDQLGKIHYRGGIDNWAITLGKQRQVISEHYLSDALNSLINEEEVEISQTRAVGCIIE
jgi:thioredoxin-related protein